MGPFGNDPGNLPDPSIMQMLIGGGGNEDGGAPVQSPLLPAQPGVGSTPNAPAATTPEETDPDEAAYQKVLQDYSTSLDNQLKARAAGPSGFFRKMFSSPQAEAARQVAWKTQQMTNFKNGMDVIRAKLAQAQSKGATKEESPEMAAYRKSQTDLNNIRVKQAQYILDHPELQKGTQAQEKQDLSEKKAAQNEMRLFNQERDRQMRLFEQGRQEKMGNVSIPVSELEKESTLADIEDNLATSYPNSKPTPRFAESRDMRDQIDGLLQKQPANVVMSALMGKPNAQGKTLDSLTVGKKQIKLTPSLRAKLVNYVDIQQRLKAARDMQPRGEAGNTAMPEVPAAAPSKMSLIKQLFGM